MGYAAWRLNKKAQEAAAMPEVDTSITAPPPSPNAELTWDELRPVEPLALEVGYRLIPLVDKAQGGELLARLKGVRRKLTQDLGFLIPAVHVRDNLELAPNAYRITVHGVPVATGELQPDREMALDPGRVFGQLDGIPTRDPAFGLDAVWINPTQRPHAESLGYTVVDPATVVATHLSHLVREKASELLGHDEVQQLLANVGKQSPKLVEELTPKLLPLSTIVRVLQSLLSEKVPLRQMRQIVEALLEHGAMTQDPAQLVAAVRTALGRFIVQELNGLNAELPVFTLAPQLERVLQDSVSGAGAALEPGLAERLHQNLSECVTRQESKGEPAVLLVPSPIRSSIARLVRHSVPQLAVLAYGEVPEDKRLRLVGSIG
jgi:flagellar biosynthesis protein FlhA